MDYITNYKELITDSSEMRKDILDILEYTLSESRPEKAIQKNVSLNGKTLNISGISINLTDIQNIYVIGGGKAGYSMVSEIYRILGSRITRGIINTKKTTEKEMGNIKIVEAGHPVPTDNGLNATGEILNIAEKAKEKDLIISLISGGGSALMCLPEEGITLEDIQRTSEILLGSGASIDEINTIRKHISQIKGGRLSAKAYPARTISLIVSDVVGDDLSIIASGPTSPDSSTFEDALSIIEKYEIENKLPESVIATIKNGVKGKIDETPSEGSAELNRTDNIIILNNLSALNCACRRSSDSGYNTLLLSSQIEGDAKECGIMHYGIAAEILDSDIPVEKPAVVISGGETTVTLEEYGDTHGGPNQECVLGFALRMQSGNRTAFLSIDTDGIDGNSEFAGGITGGKEENYSKKDISKALKDHESSRMLKEMNGFIRTGETGTNVNDIRIMCIV